MMYSLSSVRWIRVALALGLVAAGLIGAGVAAAAWTVQSSRIPGGLDGVAATSSNDAWAVGNTGSQPLIEHWDGTTWTVEPSPNPSSGDELFGVAATSSANAWAVGNYVKTSNVGTLVEHWNGTAWTVEPSPNRSSYSELSGVAATSSTNAWAVGDYLLKGGVDHTLIERWNGTAWTVQPSPNPSRSDDALYAVASTSPTNAWAVGDYYNGADDHTLIEHWNGTAWKIQPSPNIAGSSQNNDLFSVAATSPTNAWAVGHTSRHGTLIEHWNGNAWKIQPGPKFEFGRSIHAFLLGVAAVSRTNAWAVGYNNNISAHNDAALIDHWNGKAWKIQPRPTPPGRFHDDVLHGVAATSAADAWTVGSYTKTDAEHTLIEHWNGNG